MAVNQTTVTAMIAAYSREALEAARVTALADLLSGVLITQVSFEGGGASGQRISNSPSYLVEHIQAALDQIDDAELASRPNAAFVDLSKRYFGT